jgi:hypothetical protein
MQFLAGVKAACYDAVMYGATSAKLSWSSGSWEPVHDSHSIQAVVKEASPSAGLCSVSTTRLWTIAFP